MSITIVLADDHPVVRRGVRALLEAESDFSVIGEAEDGRQAIDLVERLQPNVLVVDVQIPGLNGLEVTRQVGLRVRETRILVLSMHATEAYVLQALRNGAAGYALKSDSAETLVDAVRQVAGGRRRYLCASLSERAIEVYAQRAEATLDIYDTLTNREREILQLTAEGGSSVPDRRAVVHQPAAPWKRIAPKSCKNWDCAPRPI